MKLFQYISLVILIVLSWASLFITIINQNQRIASLQIGYHQATVQSIKAIQSDSKDYINCLLQINPNKGNIVTQEQTCYNEVQ